MITGRSKETRATIVDALAIITLGSLFDFATAQQKAKISATIKAITYIFTNLLSFQVLRLSN
jgi:uncharacterized membrane protein YcaP (DUF421 family)